MSANLRQSQAHGHTPSVDARIAAIASAQRDLTTIAQLLAAGLTDGAVTRRVARGAPGRAFIIARALSSRDHEQCGHEKQPRTPSLGSSCRSRS